MPNPITPELTEHERLSAKLRIAALNGEQAGETSRLMLLAANRLDAVEMGLRRLLKEIGAKMASAADESECNCNPAERTGGDHDPSCPEWQPECSCYELIGGHQPGCYFHGSRLPPSAAGEGEHG